MSLGADVVIKNWQPSILPPLTLSGRTESQQIPVQFAPLAHLPGPWSTFDGNERLLQLSVLQVPLPALIEHFEQFPFLADYRSQLAAIAAAVELAHNNVLVGNRGEREVQMRKDGTTHFEGHVAFIAKLATVIEAETSQDPDVVAVALGHDLQEDTQLHPLILMANSGWPEAINPVVEAINVLTKPAKANFNPATNPNWRHEQMTAYVDKLMTNPLACKVKALDSYANMLTDIGRLNDPTLSREARSLVLNSVRKYQQNTTSYYLPVIEKAPQPYRDLWYTAYNKMNELLKLATESE